MTLPLTDQLSHVGDALIDPRTKSPGVATPVVDTIGSRMPNFDVCVAVLRAAMDPDPTNGLIRSPTELIEGQPLCVCVYVFIYVCVCASV